MIGILLVTTIMNGLAMMNASPFIYTIVRGLVIFIAIDSRNYKFNKSLIAFFTASI